MQQPAAPPARLPQGAARSSLAADSIADKRSHRAEREEIMTTLRVAVVSSSTAPMASGTRS